MTTLLRYKTILFSALAAIILSGGCIKEPLSGIEEDIPEGHYVFMPKFIATAPRSIISRALDNMEYIDNVVLFIFIDEGAPGIDASDPIYMREYYDYKVSQKIYLKHDESYYIYAVANLHESNIPGGWTLMNFFDDVNTYGDLCEKYVLFDVLTPDDTGKMIMTTDNPNYDPANPKGGELGGGIIEVGYNPVSTIFAPEVYLYKIQAKFIVNIYNRVEPTTREILSGVIPTSMTAANFPYNSWLVQRWNRDEGHSWDYADTNGDGIITEVGTGAFYTSQPAFLPEPESDLARYQYVSNSGQYQNSYYTKQTLHYYCFENRRGSNPAINGYIPIDEAGDPAVGPPVYGRKDLAPPFSTYMLLQAMTDQGVLSTYIHAGKGRDEQDPAAKPDDITNFDVERNCTYHFNVIINGTDDVIIDTRRDYLAQKVLFYLPEDSRVDAHYVDMPSYVRGSKAGMAKLQAGTVPESSLIRAPGGNIVDFLYDTNGVPVGWQPMTDDNIDDNWVRFSFSDPYRPTRNSIAGINEPTTSKLYISFATPVDARSGATPIIHFNEFVSHDAISAFPLTLGAQTANPPSRTAVIRVGFVENATTLAAYDSAADDYPSFTPVTQWGLKVIGRYGGWQPNEEYPSIGMYTKTLGVESIEEHAMRYYTIERAGENPPRLDYNTLGGPYWIYTTGSNTALNQTFNGQAGTASRNDQYRRQFTNGVPPVRWEHTQYPTGAPGVPGVYNPFSYTNAVDYCIRKNRDENGDGFISGDEVKWYLPTPNQATQLYYWRDAFRGGNYTLNRAAGPGAISYVPFGELGAVSSQYYWTVNEGASNAIAMDFRYNNNNSFTFTELSRTGRYAVRCVRDVDKTVPGVFYYSQNGRLVANLTGGFPSSMLHNDKTGVAYNDMNNTGYNNLASAFIISRWYFNGNGNVRSDTPSQFSGNGNTNCSSYSEPGEPNGWVLPTQQDLLFIYANIGIVENLFFEALGPPTTPTANWNSFFVETIRVGNQTRLPYHWAITELGSNSQWWRVDFASGSAAIEGKQTAYYQRCVKYLNVNTSDTLYPRPAESPAP